MWLSVQGRRFSLPGLLADEDLADAFPDATLCIFRLAPQGVLQSQMPLAWHLPQPRWWLQARRVNRADGLQQSSPALRNCCRYEGTCWTGTVRKRFYMLHLRLQTTTDFTAQ